MTINTRISLIGDTRRKKLRANKRVAGTQCNEFLMYDMLITFDTIYSFMMHFFSAGDLTVLFFQLN